MINNQNNSRHPELDSGSKTPKLRFKEFSGEWEEKQFGDIYSFYSTNSLSRDNLNYEQGNVRNIHYGDIHTKFSTLFKLENESVPFINPDVNLAEIKVENYCLVGDLVIADASEDYNDIGKSIEIISLNNEKALAGLHTFLARPNKHNMALGFVGSLLKSWNIRKQIMTLAQGTKVLSLSSGRLSEVTLNIPSMPEQQKIASFLSAIDTKIEQLTRKKELLEQYKKGAMQKVFSQELRFKADDGSEFPEWENRVLADVLTEHREKSKGKEEVYSVSVHKGLINQIEHLGRSFSAKETSQYNLVKPYDIVYTKSPTGDFPYGVIKLSKINKEVIVSPLYGVFTPETPSLGYILDVYFESPVNAYNYLASIIQKGAKNTINITNRTFLSKSLLLPIDKDEQIKIANFFIVLNTKIDLMTKKLDEAKNFKKALLQQMFV